MERKPVYLVVTQHFPSPETWRGAFVYDFVRAVMRTGRYDVRVFVPGRGPDYEYQGVRVCRFRRWALRSAVFPFLFAPLNRRIFLRRLREEGIEVSDVAVCHAHGTFMGDYALAVRTAAPRALAVLHHHDPASFGLCLGVLRHCWLHQALLYPLLLKLHEQLDVHVFISTMVRDAFRSTPEASWSVNGDYRRCLRGFSRFPNPRIRRGIVLPNGVDTARFYPGVRAEAHPFTMGCVANFIALKEHLTLLRAVDAIRAELPADWRLRLMGSGPTRRACVRFVCDRGLTDHVTFEPEVDHAALPDIYRALNLFVLPSSFEGFGCVYAEAAACGVPFIACEGQGIADILPHDYPGLIPPGDSAALAARIQAFLAAPWPPPSPPSINALVPPFLEGLTTGDGSGAAACEGLL